MCVCVCNIDAVTHNIVITSFFDVTESPYFLYLAKLFRAVANEFSRHCMSEKDDPRTDVAR